MKLFNSLAVCFLGLTLAACSSTQPIDAQTQNLNQNKPPVQCRKKNPITVSLGENPRAPYTVLGKETVSTYNVVGIKRQKANIHDAMRDLAASIGGDAIIDIQHHGKTITGTVIAYQDKQLA